MAKTYYIQNNYGYVFETCYIDHYSDVKQLSVKEGKAAIVSQYKQELAKYFVDGATIYTIIRKVSSSGMSRNIDVYAIVNNRPVYLSGYIAKVLGWPMADKGIRVSGCGMDMGFHLVSTTAQTLGIDYKTIRQEWIQGVMMAQYHANQLSNIDNATHTKYDIIKP